MCMVVCGILFGGMHPVSIKMMTNKPITIHVYGRPRLVFSLVIFLDSNLTIHVNAVKTRSGFYKRPMRKKEGNVLFYDTLNTFYLWLYGVRHMVMDHSDSEKGYLLLQHRLLFPISSKGSFTCIIPDRIIHTKAFVTPVVEHWQEQY